MLSIIPKLIKDRPLAQLLGAHAIGAVGHGFKFRVCRQRLATVAMFLRSCVAQVLSRGDGSRHSLHASA